jgi:hypothetical protein
MNNTILRWEEPRTGSRRDWKIGHSKYWISAAIALFIVISIYLKNRETQIISVWKYIYYYVFTYVITYVAIWLHSFHGRIVKLENTKILVISGRMSWAYEVEEIARVQIIKTGKLTSMKITNRDGTSSEVYLNNKVSDGDVHRYFEERHIDLEMIHSRQP